MKIFGQTNISLLVIALIISSFLPFYISSKIQKVENDQVFADLTKSQFELGKELQTIISQPNNNTFNTDDHADAVSLLKEWQQRQELLLAQDQQRLEAHKKLNQWWLISWVPLIFFLSLFIYQLWILPKMVRLGDQHKDILAFNQSLLEEKAKAEAAAKAKAEFLSNMSHEIRTPMNAVVGLIHILLETKLDEEQKEMLQTLKFSSENLLIIINDILDFSKIDAGKIQIEKTNFNLPKLLQNIQNSLLPKASKKKLHLYSKIDNRIPNIIIGDPVRISQILINLTNNAIKFTQKGEVKLQVSLIEQKEESVNLLFEVCDTGIGIPKEKQRQIFESFSQADENTTRLYGGTGLGLSICKKLVELQGSKIQVESVQNEGSRFFFALEFPISPKAKAVQKEKNGQLTKKIFNGGRKVLLVEDNQVNQLVATKFLKNWNLQYEIANDGLEAVAMVQNSNFDLVLMDLQMPNMDGYQATQEIRKLKRGSFEHLPIIALSASAILEIRELALQVGMNDFVSKPFKPEELFNAISKYIPN